MPSSSSSSSRSPSRRMSNYTLHTIDDERTSLLKGGEAPQYGAAPGGDPAKQPISAETKKKLLFAGIKMAVLFVVSTALLLLVLKLALPTLEEEDKQYLHVPRTFEQLKDLNTLLKKYRSLYPFRIVLCFVITYLFLQAFSLPGSMYMSILAGAVWGPAKAIPLCCTCVASGATLCYFIGAALGPALLVLPTWKARLDAWSVKINAERANLIPFLIVLRIAPFPPHWVVNVLCPHLGIGLVPFFVSTWLGIMGVTVIHTTIGSGLEQMTSPEDFHLISWRNFLGLSAVVVAVLIPVGLRWYFRDKVDAVAAVETQAAVGEVDLEAQEGEIVKGKGTPPPLIVFESDEEDIDASLFGENTADALPTDAKGKGVDRGREWLVQVSDDEGNDDEPLPPPPSSRPLSSPSAQDVKEDVKRLA